MEFVKTKLPFIFVMVVMYWAASASAFNGYYDKWKFFDGNPAQSLNATLDGTASQPYVYRQLLPRIANGVQSALPAQMAQAIELKLQTANGALKAPDGRDALQPGYALRYRIVYYLCFGALFAALFVLRRLALDLKLHPFAALTAPVAFALMLPILETRGGYFYDYPELLAFSLAMLFAVRGWAIPLILLAVPATMNKESFLFYCVSLLPILLNKLSWMKAVATAGVAALVSGVTYMWVKSAYTGNSGGATIFQLVDNIRFYANPVHLFTLELSYGVAFFKGYSLVVLAWFALLIKYGWPRAPLAIRRHLCIAAIINLPLLLLLCAGGSPGARGASRI